MVRREADLGENFVCGLQTTRPLSPRLDIGARLYAEGAARRSRLEARQREAVEAQRALDAAALLPRPKVVGEAKARETVARLHDDTLRERAKQEAERERARTALEALREGAWESTFKPQVSSTSAGLAAFTRDGRQSVEERLYAEGARRLETRRLAERLAAERARGAATPRITARAAALEGRGEWSRRLHIEAQFLSAKKQRPPTPSRAKTIAPAKAEARCASLFDDAKRRDEARRRARAEARRELAAQSKVTVGPRSERLAAKQPMSAAERLTGQDDKARRNLLANIVAAHDDAAAARARHSAAAEERRIKRHLDLFDDARRSADRRKARHLRSSLEQLEGCTFRPSLAAQAPPGLAVTGDVATRNRDWLQARDRKLRDLEEAKRDAEVDGCTFSPFVPPAPRSARRHSLPPKPPQSLGVSRFEAALDACYTGEAQAPAQVAP